jgi:hypothetical protein
MRIPVKLGDDKREFASSYADLKVHEFHRLKDWADFGDNDMLLLYAILLSMDPKAIRQIKRSQLDNIVGRHLSYLENKWDMSGIRTPPLIDIAGKKIAIPVRIDLISLGQYIGLDQYIMELSKKPESTIFDLERMQAVIMIVLWKEIYPDEPFSLEKLKARKSLINQCNYRDAWAIEIFFWKSISQSRKKERGIFRSMLMEIRIKLARNLSRNSGNSPRLMHSL